MRDAQLNNTASEQEFVIQKIYTKDLSLECPHSPHIFQKDWQPEINFNLELKHAKLDETLFELVMDIRVTATYMQKVSFLVEVRKAALFILKGFTEVQIEHLMGITGPSLLFPYAREVVSDLVLKAGFPPLYLAPINFEALYMQKIQAQREKESDPSTVTH